MPTTSVNINSLRYIELKSGANDRGPAWIGRVAFSRSKTTIYFNGRALRRAKGGYASGNHVDMKSGESFWVSGLKKNGEDRHWADSGVILVEAAILESYLAFRGLKTLDASRYEVTHEIVETDVSEFNADANRPIGD